MRERALALLASVGLADKRDRYPSELPGQQQRVAIAPRPDDAAAAPAARRGDVGARSRTGREVLEVVRSLAAEGMTMMIVTHERQFAREVSTRSPSWPMAPSSRAPAR